MVAVNFVVNSSYVEKYIKNIEKYIAKDLKNYD
jgi:hypothetical protein